MASTEQIKQLRELTGAGILDCKKALDQTDGDLDKATEILKAKGLAQAAKKATREAADGRVEAYIHPGDKLGVLIEVNCETDFVARTETFRELCHELAMQVAAVGPRWVSQNDVPPDVLAQMKDEFVSEVQGKPANIVERIVEGKLNKFFAENCLLDQEYIRDSEQTVGQLVTAAVAKLGENIVVKRFSRFQIG
jgi:elongation factor Ts